MTLFELRKEVTRLLNAANVDDATTTARYLICDTMNLSLTQMMIADRDSVDEAMATSITDKAQRIANGEPLQYVTHKAFFGNLEMWVDKGVLIPRPETELLVDTATSFILDNGKSCRVLDIGTGSGCIAISIKSNVPEVNMTAIDISPDAVSIARKNAQGANVDVHIFLSDIFSTDNGLGQYDVVVSNPPYICNKEKSDMKPNVLLHEPHIALFVPDNDPLLYYRHIAKLCKNGLLSPGGALFFEINEAYSEETMQMLKDEGFNNITRLKDAYDKWRVCWAKL